MTKSLDSEFEGFSNFELDLTCLSRPTSPAPSSTHLPPISYSPPPTPPPIQPRPLSRTRSFAQQALSLSPLKKSSKKLPSTHTSSSTLPPSNPRGSWPGMKYTGRGTPIDRSRNREWGSLIVEEDEVAEDGLLFSNHRSASLDSHVRSSRLSPEWNYLPPLLSATNSHAEEDEATEGEYVDEPPPELAPINLSSGQGDEWDSIMKTVLGSKDPEPEIEATPPTKSGPSGSKTDDGLHASSPEPGNGLPIVDYPMMTPAQIEELHTGLETHLGIHQALDLGLGINISQGSGEGRMNLFKLGLLPSSASGRETPSIYSQAETPRGSRAPTILFNEHRVLKGDSDQRSTFSTKAEGPRGDGGRSDDHPWWRKVLRTIRRLQQTLNTHKRRMH